jgi:2-C-methyl-D-erythritol 4-phosphate cytidylyltransferase/2-C-methyl-D-erythritol 2,4-cyclodiphosphate synthase
MSRSISVIIPAAGRSLRFQKTAPEEIDSKLFAEIKSEPLAVHTLRVFETHPFVSEIIIPVSAGLETRFRKSVLTQLKSGKRVILVRGGKTRAESVLNGLKRVSKSSNYVCIHDAARPLADPKWLDGMMKEIGRCDAVVVGRQSVPTMKSFNDKTGDIMKTLNRSELFEAETPQLIRKEIFLRAYRELGPEALEATDDVSLIEAIGGRVKAFLHSGINIKVTTYQDLDVVRGILGKEDKYRFGLGFDSHRLAAKRPFYLGGIRIASTVGPLGHSDGDPLIHAITDGILGAIGAGDIGDLFSDRNPKWKGTRSDFFVKTALELARKKGYCLKQVDATVILEKPKLGPKKEKIRKHLAKLFSLKIDCVSLKAKTAEGLGPIGAGEAVSAQALVVLKGKS